jgi:pimeloyl-ACP methyl ester carboxylesterase
MHIQTRDRLNLHVQEMGSGPTVVMVHGITANMTTWYFGCAPALARTHRVILYDLRGHGRSDRPPTGYALETMLNDLADVIGRKADGPVSLVGHSYGAILVLAFALAHPELVRRVAAVEAPLPMASWLAEVDALAARSSDAVFDVLLPASLRGAVAGGGRRGRRFMQTVNSLLVDTSVFPDTRATGDISGAELSRVGVPVLAVSGSWSERKDSGPYLAGVIPGARHVRIEGGHNLPHDSPVILSEEVRRFFDDREVPS